MKYAVVTGASGGIGEATVNHLLQNNCYVIGLDIIESTITNENFYFLKCDLTNLDELNTIKTKISAITNNIDVIYNLAGIFILETMLDGSEEDLRKIIEINFFSTYRLNKILFPLLSKGSKIIVFSSEVARYSPQPFDGYYALSKVLVDRYADIFRRELNYLGVKVIKVQAGAIKTRLLDGVNKKYEKTLAETKYYKGPLTKLKKLMDDEINKQTDPNVVAKILAKIGNKKKTKILYKVKNSFKLRFLNSLPEKLQDYIYVRVIK